MWWLVPIAVAGLGYLLSGDDQKQDCGWNDETVAKMDKYVWNPKYNPYNT